MNATGGPAPKVMMVSFKLLFRLRGPATLAAVCTTACLPFGDVTGTAGSGVGGTASSGGSPSHSRVDLGAVSVDAPPDGSGGTSASGTSSSSAASTVATSGSTTATTSATSSSTASSTSSSSGGGVFCLGGETLCDGACVDTATSLAHCGGCNMACPSVAGAKATCSAGTCGFTCESPFKDCNGEGADGCESDLSVDVLHCGGCNKVCPPASGAQATCSAGTCGFACNAGFGDCNGKSTDGCESKLSVDVAHCGGCNNACPPVAGAKATCSAGKCGFACNAGFDDCNLKSTDGCESNLATDVANCGGCGVVCPQVPGAKATCTAGVCGFACNKGLDDCNGNAADGCEFDVSKDPLNCGACGNVCPNKEACVVSACDPNTCLGEVGFALVAEYAVPGGYAGALGAGDLDGDGDLDVVSATTGSVLMNLGKGKLDAPQAIMPSKAMNYFLGGDTVYVSDLNGDGVADLVFGRGYDWVWVALGLGKPALTFDVSMLTGIFPSETAVALGDFDGDGDIDLAANYDWLFLPKHTALAYTNNGQGQFGNAFALDTPSLSGTFASLAAGDFNEDGMADVAVYEHWDGPALVVYLALGKGAFAPAPPVYGLGRARERVHGHAVITGDFNNDGHLDLLAERGWDTKTWIYLLLGDGKGGFSVSLLTSASDTSREMARGDFDGDGNLDLVVVLEQALPAVAVFRGHGDGTFDAPLELPITLSKPEWVGSVGRAAPLAADLDGDGKDELLVQYATYDSVTEKHNAPIFVFGRACL